MSESTFPLHPHPGKGLLSLAAAICRDEPNTGVVGIGYPEAYNWTPLTDEPFEERIEIWNARVEQPEDPYFLDSAYFVIGGHDEEHFEIKRALLPEIEVDSGAFHFYRRFYDIYASHVHERCLKEERMRQIIASGETPLVSLRQLNGEVLKSA